MRDKDLLTNLLDEFGFRRVEAQEFNQSMIDDRTYLVKDYDYTSEVFISKGQGYSDFYAVFTFDKRGYFLNHGVFE